jgi:membrane protein DedA with SNARE-associated domain
MLQALIAKYGYLAILIGTFFEGETILVLGGFAAHRGYLMLAGVAAIGLSFWSVRYFLGRRRRPRKPNGDRKYAPEFPMSHSMEGTDRPPKG